MGFIRPIYEQLQGRALEEDGLIQVLLGPRQVGKTTLMHQLTDDLPFPIHFATADSPVPYGPDWVAAQWDEARARVLGDAPGVLIIDEIQKTEQWSEIVKRKWDEDRAQRLPLRVFLLGSSHRLIHTGLTESLAGRFEVIRVPHWSFAEMRDAFGLSLDRYIYAGGYPGAARFTDDPQRWRRYVLDAIIEVTLSRDLMIGNEIRKPALFRRLFELACTYSGQILSYQKMLGQLQDAGNTTTLAHYLDLLEQVRLVAGLQKFTQQTHRTRASSPKLQVFNNALMSAFAPQTMERLKASPEVWGRWVESAVGSHLLNSAAREDISVSYWREGRYEVDFVVTFPDAVLAIEVKSGATTGGDKGLRRFCSTHPGTRAIRVGPNGFPLERMLVSPVASLLSSSFVPDG